MELLRPLSRFWNGKPVQIYDPVFKLHSKVTVSLLIGCTVFLSAKQYFGETIDCMEGKSSYKKQLDHFCWMTGTFIANHHINGTIGEHLVHYGVAPRYVPEKDRNYQKYYQWVPIFLMIHALILSFPAYCWKVWEKRTMHRLIGSLGDDFFPKPEKEAAFKNLFDFFLHSHYRLSHRLYALHYLLAEILNLAMVIANLALLNFFLEGFWWKFWPAVSMLVAFDYNSWLSSTASVFPRLAKCEFFYVGPSGSIQSIHSLCLLPLNVLNEKIYAGIYLWFLFLFAVSALNVLWKLLLSVCRPLRMLVIRAQFREVPSYYWDSALDGGSFSQWFLFQQIGRNLSTNLVFNLADRLCHTVREEYYLK